MTVVENTEVAAAASGKAGGFLALDWCVGTPLDPLARRSFQLHADLPQEIADDWGYRPMTAYGGLVVSQSDSRRQKPSELDWLSNGVVIASRLPGSFRRSDLSASLTSLLEAGNLTSS